MVSTLENSRKVPLLHMETGDLVLSVEDICRKYTGVWGLWQMRSFLIVSLVKIPSAWQMASILFTAAEPFHILCAPPEYLKNLSVDFWRNYSHPKIFDKNARKEVWNPCYIFDIDYSTLIDSNSTFSTPENSSKIPCRKFEYDSNTTIVTQWDLICERSILVSVSQFFYLFGVLVGGIVATKLIEKLGPRRIIIAAMTTQIITGIIIVYSPYLELNIFMRFLVACSCCNMFTAGYVICSDINTAKEQRTICQCCYEHFWSIGVITLALLAYALPNWRDLQLALSTPTMLILLCFEWIPNSPKWLLSTGRYEKAVRELSKAAKLNGLPQPPKDLEKYVRSKSHDNSYAWREFIQKNGIAKTSALHVIWACTVVTYYGALLNVKNLGDNVMLNTIIAGLAEVAGVLLGLAVILNSRRKWLYLGLIQLIGGAMCLSCWAVPVKVQTWEREAIMLSLGMGGRIAIAFSLTLLQVSSSELIEASYQKIGMFSCITFARVFLTTAPFIGFLAQYGNNISLSVFGMLTVLGGFSAFILNRFQQPS